MLIADAGSTARADHQPAPLSGPNAPSALGQLGCGALQWFVVRHRPYEGQTTRDAIRKLGFYAHHFREEVRKPGRDDVLRACFPGYLFVRFSPSASWGPILRLSSVVGILSAPDGTPSAASEAEMKRLREKFDDRDIMLPEKPAQPQPREIGKQYAVRGWDKLVGECTALGPKDRVTLLIEVFGQSREQSFPAAQLSEVG